VFTSVASVGEQLETETSAFVRCVAWSIVFWTETTSISQPRMDRPSLAARAVIAQGRFQMMRFRERIKQWSVLLAASLHHLTCDGDSRLLSTSLRRRPSCDSTWCLRTRVHHNGPATNGFGSPNLDTSFLFGLSKLVGIWLVAVSLVTVVQNHACALPDGRQSRDFPPPDRT
jgi:hypothetical protein